MNHRLIGGGFFCTVSLYCDDRHLAAEMGALAGAGLEKEGIHAESGEIIADIRSGLFGAVGLGFGRCLAC
ncbi:hypothetical protein PLACP1_17810 [Planifilum fimeticola]